MQIALVAVVLLAGMWFTVLKPKPAAETAAAPPVAVTPAPASSSEPVAPGVKGLTSAVEKAKGASAASDATNAKIQKATGSAPAAAATPAAAAAKPAVAKATPAASKAAKHTTPAKAKAKTTAAARTGTKAAAPALKVKPAAAKAPTTAARKAVPVDPSARLLKFLDKGKTLVILFHGAGADDRGARKAVHRTAKADPKHVTSAYIPIGDVGKYEAITSDVQILAAPSILVIGTNGKATLLTGYVDAAVVRQTVGDARRASAADAKSKSKK
jgi:cytoskeletal protein RodZ